VTSEPSNAPGEHAQPNRYTHAPRLNARPLFGSLQLLVWLLLHPTAWRNHGARSAPDHAPDFVLSELTFADWRKVALRRMLLLVYGAWPPLVGVTVAALLLMGGVSPRVVIFGVILGVTLGWVGGLITGAAISVAAGFATLVIAGIGLGVSAAASGILLDIGPSVVMLGVGRIESNLTTGAIGFISVGAIGSVAAMVAARSNPAFGISATSNRPFSAIAVGLLIGAGVIGVTRGLVAFLPSENILLRTWLLRPSLIGSLLVGIMFGAAILLRTRRPVAGLGWGLALAIVAAHSQGLMSGVMADALLQSVVSNPLSSVTFSLSGLVLGPLFALMAGLVLVPLYVVVERFLGAWAGAVASSVGGGGAFVLIAHRLGESEGAPWPLLVLGLLCVGVGLSYPLWLPLLLYPLEFVWNGFLYHLDNRRAENSEPYLYRHSVFWDEHQWLPMPELSTYLVLAHSRSPDAGAAALAFVSHSRQAGAARAAQIELDARRLDACDSLDTIVAASRHLTSSQLRGPASSILRSLGRVGADIATALDEASLYKRRLALRSVEDRLDGLQRELTRSNERYAKRFRPIAVQWRQLLADAVHELGDSITLRQEIESPYVIGLPLTVQHATFVGRRAFIAELERHLADPNQPVLLMVGQPRMGKTSLLNHLGRLLPSEVIPLVVGLDGPAALAGDTVGFLYNVARGICTSAQRQRDLTLPPLPRARLEPDPLTEFDAWLDEVEAACPADGVGLLALDDVETLDESIGQGRVDADAIFHLLQHTGQRRAQFRLLLTSAHGLDELVHCPHYLETVQTLPLGYLSAEETRQLVERPTPDFALQYEPDASPHVYALTHGHPALTQLLCTEIVVLKNEGLPARRRLVTRAEVETAAARALDTGGLFFTEMASQVGEQGRMLLRFMAQRGAGAVVSRADLAAQTPLHADEIIARLLRRGLIETVEPPVAEPSIDEPGDTAFRIPVELFRRWVADVG